MVVDSGLILGHRLGGGDLAPGYPGNQLPQHAAQGAARSDLQKAVAPERVQPQDAVTPAHG